MKTVLFLGVLFMLLNLVGCELKITVHYEPTPQSTSQPTK